MLPCTDLVSKLTNNCSNTLPIASWWRARDEEIFWSGKLKDAILMLPRIALLNKRPRNQYSTFKKAAQWVWRGLLGYSCIGRALLLTQIPSFRGIAATAAGGSLFDWPWNAYKERGGKGGRKKDLWKGNHSLAN